ncbi:MAG: hypothetical protein ACI4SH_08490, partial [Candidatus Scatosoma sp.]
MKSKWFKLVCGAALSAALLVSFSVGTAESVSAAAETTYNYWHFTEGSGSYEVSLNSQATGMSSGYYGVETKVTRTDSTVKNMGVMLNGMVAPMYTSGDAGKTIVYFDDMGLGTATADAVGVTFTGTADMTKQISIVGTARDNKTYYTVAFTDDITVQDGYALVNGKKTIGASGLTSDGTTSAIAGYSDSGYTTGSVLNGAPFSGDVIYHIGRNGIVYSDNSMWSKLADITDETFLSMSRQNAAGSGYEERYTAEYAAEILSAFENGCTMTITWYGLRVNTVDFHLRAYTGYNCSGGQSFAWIDDGGKELAQWNLRPVVYQKIEKVYKYKTYRTNELLGAYSFYPDSEAFTGYRNCDAEGNGGTWFN